MLCFFRVLLINCLQLCLKILIFYGQDLKVSFYVLFSVRKDVKFMCKLLDFLL